MSSQEEEQELIEFRKDAALRIKKLAFSSDELAAQHEQLMARRDALPAGHPEKVELTQAIADVTEQQKITNQAMETATVQWKEAGARLSELRTARERQNFAGVNLRDLPRIPAGRECDGHESASTSSRHSSSKIPDDVSEALSTFCTHCMVCGRAASTSIPISKAHILNGETRDFLGLANDTTNYVALCGTFRQQGTCHDLFDKGAMVFVHTTGTDATQWTTIGGTAETHSKSVVLATKPHRRSMNARFRSAINQKRLQLPDGAMPIRRDEDLSESPEK